MLLESGQLAGAPLELVGVFRAGFLAGRKARHHLSQPGGQRARKRGAGTSARCRRRRRHRFHKSFRLRRQTGLLSFSQHSRQAVFQNLLLRVKALQLQEEVAAGFQRALGDQAHDLAAHNGDAIAFGFALDHLEGAEDGSALKVGEVHGNLGQVARLQVHAHGLDVAQAAAGKTDSLADFLGDADVAGVQVDVVSDQKLPRPDHSGAGGGVQARLANVGRALRVGDDFLAQALELSATDVLQVGALRAGGGFLVEIDGNLVAFPDLFAHLPGQLDAVLDGDAFDGERTNSLRKTNTPDL